jgi:2Fe-2S ferredoxin
MTKLFVVDRSGHESALEARSALSVMENIRDGGISDMVAMCGGCCSCATCHVYVEERWLHRVGSAGAAEAELLDSSGHRQMSSRLSCQIVMSEDLDGLRVTIAPEE